MVQRSSEGHGSLVAAKKTVANTCSCLQRPFNLLISCQSIRRQPDQMSAAARDGEEGARQPGRGSRGTDCMSGEAENEGEVKRAAACAYQRRADRLEQTAPGGAIGGFLGVCGVLLMPEWLKFTSDR